MNVLNFYKDLWLTSNQRANSIRRGIQSTKLSKLRLGATSGSANAGDNRLKRIFENKYKRLLDCTMLTNQHSFYPYIEKEDIEIDLYYQISSLLISSTDAKIVTDYNFCNISFEYDASYEPSLAQQIIQLSDTYGIIYLYDYKSYIGKNALNQLDLKFSLTILDPRRSVREILMLIKLPPSTANRDPEKFFNPEITNVDITVNGITNRVFAQCFKEDQMWTKARKLFLNEYKKINGQLKMTLSTFYGISTYSSYCFWLYLRSSDYNTLHGKGMKIERGSNVVLNFTKNNIGSGKTNVYTYLIADAIIAHELAQELDKIIYNIFIYVRRK